MSELKFKTNINCGGCIANVTDVLNKIAGQGNWNVDITDPSKLLTIATEPLSAEEVTKALQEVGYKATVSES